MARRTSIKVFHQIKQEGLLSRRRLQVYEVLFGGGPLTGAQVADIVKKRYGAWGHSETIRNRLTELRDSGCVVELGEVACPISGRQVILWDVNDQLPKKLEKSETKVDQLRARIRELEEEVRALRAAIQPGKKRRPRQMIHDERQATLL